MHLGWATCCLRASPTSYGTGETCSWQYRHRASYLFSTYGGGKKIINFRISQFNLLLPADISLLLFLFFFPCLSAFCLPARVLPQSARWLLANDRKEEAITLLRKAALVNGRVLPPTLHVCLSILNFLLNTLCTSSPGLTLPGWLSVRNWQFLFFPLRSWQRDVAKHLFTELDRDVTNQRTLWQIVCFQIQTVSMYIYWLTWLCSESLPKALHCTKSRSVTGYARFSLANFKNRAHVWAFQSKLQVLCLSRLRKSMEQETKVTQRSISYGRLKWGRGLSFCSTSGKSCKKAQSKPSNKQPYTNPSVFSPVLSPSLFINVRFVNVLVYYGLSLGVSRLGTNLYLTQFVFGLVEIPARSLVLVVLPFSRRFSQSGFLATGGLACLLMLAVPAGMVSLLFCGNASF